MSPIDNIKNINIIYYWQPHNKINGTLFYCYEYYYFLLTKNKNTNFYIVNCKSEYDKRLISQAFDSKYNKELIKDNNIKFITNTHVYNLKNDKLLFLDIYSYNHCYMFISNKDNCFVYCNNKYDMIESVKYPHYLFGYYNYQHYNYRTTLKLNFNIFKKINIDYKFQHFISSPGSDKKQIEKYLNDINSFKFKQHNICENIFEAYYSIIYIHNGVLDTNNRLIPESKFYNKKLNIIFTDKYKIPDSIIDRYERDIQYFWLDEKDLLIEKILQ